MNKFLSLCVLSAILMAFLATVKADFDKDVSTLYQHIETIKKQQAKIKTFVTDGLLNCYNKHNRFNCDLSAAYITNALYNPYNKAVDVFNANKDKPHGKMDLKPKEIMRLALRELKVGMEDGFKGLSAHGRYIEQKTSSESINILSCWDRNEISEFKKEADELYKKYAPRIFGLKKLLQD